jgi:drug/metabolite transporter (DMT)-like permease
MGEKGNSASEGAEDVHVDVAPAPAKTEPERPWYASKLIMGGIFVVINTCTTVFYRAAQDENRKYSFNPSTLVLLAEILKLLIATTFVLRDGDSLMKDVTGISFLKFGVPGFIYFLLNNGVFYLFTFIEPGQASMMMQTKILWTMVLMGPFLGRQFTTVQKCAGILLFIGAVVMDSKGHCASEGEDEENKKAIGAGALILSQMISIGSAVAGVYSEALAKFGGSIGGGAATKVSLHKQNMQLYTWGILFGTLSLIRNNDLDAGEEGEGAMAKFMKNSFSGIGFFAVLIVLAASLNGLMVSAIVRYIDNMVKLMGVSVAAGTSLVISSYFFGAEVSIHTILGGMVIAVSTFLYGRE